MNLKKLTRILSIPLISVSCMAKVVEEPSNVSKFGSPNFDGPSKWSANGECDLGRRSVISQRSYYNHRPNDFYRLCGYSELSACENTLARLNHFSHTPISERPNRVIDSIVPRSVGDALWPSRKVLLEGYHFIYFSEIDVYNDGILRDVFLTYNNLRGRPYLSTYVSEETSNDKVSSYRELIAQSDSSGKVGFLSMPATLKNLWSNDPTNFAVVPVEVKNKNLIAFLPSSLTDKDAVFVFSMESRSEGELVCEFKPKYTVERE